MARKKTGLLGTFEGGPVDDMSVIIRKAGDGLSEALKVDPRTHSSGDECFFVLRTIVGPVNHKPKTVGLPESGFTRVEDHIAQEITEVDSEQVSDMLEEAAERLQLAREEAAGVTRLPMDGEANEDAE